MENYTIGKLKIANREYDVKECELKQIDLNFYIDNPRVYSALRNISVEDQPSQEEIEELMCNMEHVKQLRLSIESNGGLIDPLIVRDGDFVVLEGNSRLAAYRILFKKDPIKWGYAKCKVLPADIDDSAIFTLLGQYHIVGRKDWSPFEQAGYLYRRQKDTKYPPSQMAKELGISEAKSKTYLKVYEYMIEKNDLVPEHWSYYEELLKNRNITKASEKDVKLKNKIVDDIKEGKFIQAADIRKIGEIIGLSNKKSNKVISEYVSGDVDIYTAYEEIKDSGSLDEVVKKLKKFREFIVEPSLLENDFKGEPIFLLKKIYKEIGEIIKKIEGK